MSDWFEVLGGRRQPCEDAPSCRDVERLPAMVRLRIVPRSKTRRQHAGRLSRPTSSFTISRARPRQMRQTPRNVVQDCRKGCRIQAHSSSVMQIEDQSVECGISGSGLWNAWGGIHGGHREHTLVECVNTNTNIKIPHTDN